MDRVEFNQWFKGNQTVIPPVEGLHTLVERVHDADEAWLTQLNGESPFGNNPDIETKVTILGNLDEALLHSFNAVAQATNIPNDKLDETLNGLLIEIEGYKRLSHPFFLDLRRLSETDDVLKKAARDARLNLFNKADKVQRELQKAEPTNAIKASDFDLCTEKFLARLQELNLPAESKVKDHTESLFRNRRLMLEEPDLKNLINAWGDVVSGFVKDAQDTPDFGKDEDGYEFGEPATIADFICMHDRLDTLYSRLATNVSRN
jgi:hypothetical protein